MKLQRQLNDKEPIGGTFIILFYGVITAPIPYDASDIEIQTAIDLAKKMK